MEELTSCDENYLEAIYVLTERKKGPIQIADVAAYLGLTPQRVSKAIVGLKRRACLWEDERHGLLLTQSGLEKGRQLYERDCFFYRVFIRLGVEPAEAAQNAYRFKQAVSAGCYERLCAVFPQEADEAQRHMRGERKKESRPDDVLRERACASHERHDGNWQGTWNELVRAAERQINENYMQKFSLQNIAGAIHVNPCYLERVFRETTGQTLLAFHNCTRCKVARRLLENTQLNITQISSQVGFVSPAHFSRVFRKVEGRSPSEYRKGLR